jgi:hypothetical protein
MCVPQIDFGCSTTAVKYLSCSESLFCLEFVELSSLQEIVIMIKDKVTLK